MVNWQTLASVIIFLVLSGILYAKRKNVEFQGKFPFFYAGLIRTKLGLKAMDWGGEKLGWLIRPLSIIGIGIGFIGMLIITCLLIVFTFLIFAHPDAPSNVQLVLPIQVKGIYYIPFLPWILAIFLLATVHEFSHGIVARAFKIKVKSSGFAFLAIFIPLVPAAFVEPDEKELTKRSRKEQLAVYAAGPFSNMLFALFLIILFIVPQSGFLSNINIFQIQNNLFDVKSLVVDSVAENSPAQIAGLPVGTQITMINNIPITEKIEFANTFQNLTPGKHILLGTNSSSYDVILGNRPENASVGYIGIGFTQQEDFSTAAEKMNPVLRELLLFIVGRPFSKIPDGFISILINLNLGIGLFNLVPLGPVDGGRMFFTALTRFISEKRAKKIWSVMSVTILGILLLNIAVGFIR